MNPNRLLLIAILIKAIQTVTYPGICHVPGYNLLQSELNDLQNSTWRLELLLPDNSGPTEPSFFQRLTPQQLRATRLKFDFPIVNFYQTYPTHCLNMVGNLTVGAARTSYTFYFQLQVGILSQGKPITGRFENRVFKETTLSIWKVQGFLIIWKCLEKEEWDYEADDSSASYNLEVMVLSNSDSIPVNESDNFNLTRESMNDWVRSNRDDVLTDLVCPRLDCPIPEPKWHVLVIGLFIILLLPLLSLIKQRGKVTVVPLAPNIA